MKSIPLLLSLCCNSRYQLWSLDVQMQLPRLLYHYLELQMDIL